MRGGRPHLGLSGSGGRRTEPRSTLLHWPCTILIVGGNFFFFHSKGSLHYMPNGE